MSETLKRVRRLVEALQVKVSVHGFERLSSHDIGYADVLASLDDAMMVEDYPDYVHGPSVLVLQTDGTGQPIHVLWGLPAGSAEIAVLVTAYRPDPARWDEGYMTRSPR